MDLNCLIVDVIRQKLATCNYTLCDDECRNYLLSLDDNCPVVFHNIEYVNLWHTLYTICFSPH